VLEPLYSAAEIRTAEEAFPGFPDSAAELMERAGEAVAREAMRAFPRARRFAVVCGRGSNGGDGRVAARVLSANGREAVETMEPEGYDVVIDALLGTGFHGSLRPEAAAVIERVNTCGAPVAAVDLPSGVDASTGEIQDAAVDAAVTVTFHGRKVGLAVAPGRFHAGRVVVADIGLERRDTVLARATEGILRLVPHRAPRDSKYTAGVVLVVGGSPGMTGAAVLVASAALRADVGYVTLAVPQDSLPIVETLAVEPVKRGFGWADPMGELAADIARCDAIAVGPGLGRSGEARELVRRLLEETDRPAVVDADALFGLAPVARAAPTVLTPHAGELARLLETDSAWVNAHRLEAASAAADRYGAVVLLKGADTIVQAPGTGAIVCDLAPPSLATAGSGDVLTGVIASFLAKGLEPRLAAAAGAIAHGAAAASVPHQAGLIAGDIVAALPAALA
jgi:NAD(P)H-hydrate epimerase